MKPTYMLFKVEKVLVSRKKGEPIRFKLRPLAKVEMRKTK